MFIENVLVEMPEAMPVEEVEAYVKEEIDLWKAKGKELAKVMIAVEGEEVVIKAIEKSPIRRIRRITGYLSESLNFNDAKRAELAERINHI